MSPNAPQAARPHLVVLGMRGTLTPLRPFVEPALRRGARLTWVTKGPPSDYLAAHADVVDADLLGAEEAVVAALDARHAEEPVSAVLAFAEELVPLAGRLSERWGLATNPELAGIRTTDKWEMRKALAAAGVPVPGFALASTRGEYDAAVARFGFPCVVKPVQSSGSRGVMIVRDAETAEHCWEWTRAVSRQDAGRDVVLVEEFIDGPEFSAEVVVAEGEVAFLSCTEKLLIGGDFRDEIGHLHPYRFDPSVAPTVDRVVRDTVAAVGVRRGGCHVEFKVNGARVHVMEIASRLGGAGIPTLVKLATGADLADLAYAACLGEALDIPPDRGMYAGVRFATVTQPAIVHSGRVHPQIRALPGVLQAIVFASPGDVVAP
ncbi:MAG TPA: ATP-grasp domain-containing protein, partial [Longimicrobiaceae bacterium]|nr:ATP-grasp domain-containing protein [Longimicrobiaceae bacterium]